MARILASSYSDAFGRGVPQPNIVRSVVIGVMRVATGQTEELGLTLAIALVAVTAARASATGVPRIARFNPHTHLTGDVRELGEQGRERPAVMDKASLLGNPNPVTNAFQVFDHDHARPRFDSLSHDAIGDVPQLPIHRAFLPTRQPFQQSPLRASALVPFRFGFERTPLFESAESQLADAPAFENFAGADSRNLPHARIDADRVGARRVGNLIVNDKAKIPVTLLLHERGGVGNLPTAVKVLLMVSSKDQPDFDAPAFGRESGFSLFNLERERSGIGANPCCFLPAVCFCRLRLSFVGFGDDSASRADEVRWQGGQFADRLVSEVMERDRVANTLRKSDAGSLIQGFRIGGASQVKGEGVTLADFQFNLEGDGGLHLGNSTRITVVTQVYGRACGINPQRPTPNSSAA
jgi:hypothetical protein